MKMKVKVDMEMKRNLSDILSTGDNPLLYKFKEASLAIPNKSGRTQFERLQLELR